VRATDGSEQFIEKKVPEVLAARDGLMSAATTGDPVSGLKWNPSEDRCCNLISGNWAGQPLESYETMLKHLRATKSASSFRCQARWDYCFRYGLYFLATSVHCTIVVRPNFDPALLIRPK